MPLTVLRLILVQFSMSGSFLIRCLIQGFLRAHPATRAAASNAGQRTQTQRLNWVAVSPRCSPPIKSSATRQTNGPRTRITSRTAASATAQPPLAPGLSDPASRPARPALPAVSGRPRRAPVQPDCRPAPKPDRGRMHRRSPHWQRGLPIERASSSTVFTPPPGSTRCSTLQLGPDHCHSAVKS